MKMTQRGLAGVIILDLEGRLILGDGEQEFRDKVDELLRQGHTKILVNMNAVTYIDSAGVGAVVWKYITLVRKGGMMKLLHLKTRTHTVLSITKLLTVLEAFDTEMDAVLSFSNPTPPARRSLI
jgi:anti-sigma B factor antagonist